MYPANGNNDWCQQMRRCVKQARLIVVKVGSAVLTGPSGLEQGVLSSLAAQMAHVRGSSSDPRRLVLVSSGAVAAGRALLAKSGQQVETEGLSAKQAAAAIGQGQLMQAWDAAFGQQKMLTAQVLLTRDDLRARHRFLNVRNTFAELLQWNVLPIVNENDTVSISGLKFGDNDCMASLLVNLIGADLFVNLTSAPGVYGENPQNNPDASILEHIDDIEKLDLGRICGGKTLVGTGGMYSKLLAARRAAQIGVPTLILPGRKPNVLASAFDGHLDGGTWVCAGQQSISRRKFWLAYQSEPAGNIIIDAGAAKALCERGGSLLPGGVRQVEGNFQQGALVRISHDSKSLGVGLSNYGAGDLKKIMGLKRHEVAAILGEAQYPEVIHRDNLLLDAAV